MYRLILKNCCLVLLIILIENNTISAQCFSKTANKYSFVTLAGLDGGKISMNTLKSVKGLEIIAPFKILEYTIIINDSFSGLPVTYYIIRNNEISKVLSREIESRKKGFTLIFDEIRVQKDSNDFRKAPPEVFQVIPDSCEKSSSILHIQPYPDDYFSHLSIYQG